MRKHWMAHIVMAVAIVVLLAIILQPVEPTTVENPLDEHLKSENERLKTEIQQSKTRTDSILSEVRKIESRKPKRATIQRRKYEDEYALPDSAKLDSTITIIDQYVPVLDR